MNVTLPFDRLSPDFDTAVGELRNIITNTRFKVAVVMKDGSEGTELLRLCTLYDLETWVTVHANERVVAKVLNELDQSWLGDTVPWVVFLTPWGEVAAEFAGNDNPKTWEFNVRKSIAITDRKTRDGFNG